ncbi:histidinol-phosphate transaminase [Patescibacteria group bacterium]
MTIESIKQLVCPNIQKLKPYICARYKYNEGILLDANENPYGKYNRYPDPYSKEIKRELSDFLGLKYQNIFIGNGSDEAIDLLIRAFCEPFKDEIIILEPTYGMYEVVAKINNISCNYVNLGSDFQIDLPKTLKAINKNTKIMFLCSPNNPTGNCLSDKDILSICDSFKGIVVVDEAYIEFAEKKSLKNKMQLYSNLIILRTLSKSWGAAGIRLGYALADEFIIQTLNKIKAPYNINKLSQKYAVKILKNFSKIQKQIQIIVNERKRLSKRLSKMGIKVFPSQANFLLFKIPQASEIKSRLAKKGIIVRNRSDLPSLENCLRISIGKRNENNQFLKCLKQCLNKTAFIDRDGVILFEPQDDYQIDSIEKYRILPGVFSGLKKLIQNGYKLVLISNQDGLGTSSFKVKDFQIVQNKMLLDLKKEGIEFDKIFICPHFLEDKCNCRKPKIGLIEEYRQQEFINYEESIMIGDRKSDLEFAKNIGIRAYKAKTNSDSLEQIINKLIP